MCRDAPRPDITGTPRSARRVKGAALCVAGAEPRAGPLVLDGRVEHGEHPPFDPHEPTVFHITLDWIRDPALRRRANAGLNKGEARNPLARAIFFHRLGELRDRSFENQVYRASGLNLLVAAVILGTRGICRRPLTRSAAR